MLRVHGKLAAICNTLTIFDVLEEGVGDGLEDGL